MGGTAARRSKPDGPAGDVRRAHPPHFPHDTPRRTLAVLAPLQRYLRLVFRDHTVYRENLRLAAARARHPHQQRALCPQAADSSKRLPKRRSPASSTRKRIAVSRWKGTSNVKRFALRNALDDPACKGRRTWLVCRRMCPGGRRSSGMTAFPVQRRLRCRRAPGILTAELSPSPAAKAVSRTQNQGDLQT